jgi:hypothetical protein
MNQRLEQEIKQIEHEYMEADKPFTALDIGNELKNRGVNVRQRDVSVAVRGHFNNSCLYQDSNYTRVMIPVKEGEAEAFLYLRVGTNPFAYTETNQDAVHYDPAKPMFSDISDVVDQISVEVQFPANKRSKVVHSAGCVYSLKISQKNAVGFEDIVTAEANCYRKCRRE